MLNQNKACNLNFMFRACRTFLNLFPNRVTKYIKTQFIARK